MTGCKKSYLPFLLFATACSSSPQLRTYLLTPPLEAATRAAPSSTGDSLTQNQHLEVRRILVPDYLDSTDILMRIGSDEVKPSATGRWAERLSLGLTRAMSADLTTRMPQYSIVDEGSSHSPRQLRITISSLDLWKDGRCVLAANWTIVDQNGAMPEASDSATFVSLNAGGATSGTDAGLVDAVASALGELADRIARDVQTTSEHADLGVNSKRSAMDRPSATAS